MAEAVPGHQAVGRTTWGFAFPRRWRVPRICASINAVRISVEDRAIVIRPVENAVLTLEERLALFDPQKHGGEVMQSPALGAERW